MMTTQQRTQDDSISTKVAMISVFIIFLSSLSALFLVYKTFPKVTEEERQYIKLPWNIEDVKHLGIVLNRYKGDHYFQVMVGVFITYILYPFHTFFCCHYHQTYFFNSQTAYRHLPYQDLYFYQSYLDFCFPSLLH
jgi:hypothetical protein